MGDYLTARRQIAAIIETVSITDPVNATIRKCHQFVPDGGRFGEYPFVHITGYELIYDRGPSGSKSRRYRIGLRLAARPIGGSAAEMQDITDAFKDAISTAFDSKKLLGLGHVPGSNYNVVQGPNWLLEEPEKEGGIVWDQGEIHITTNTPTAFSDTPL